MYVAPALTDLGSFQELTLSAHAATGAVMGPVGSLLDTVGGAVKGALDALPGVALDDNAGTHIGTDNVTVDHKIVLKPR